MRKSRTLVLSLIAAATLALPAQAFADVAHVEKSVSFRENPSVSGAFIRYLKKDENVTILERVNDYWLKVRDSSNRVGFVTTQSQYISIQPSSGSTAPASGSAGVAHVVKAVSFRENPSVSGAFIRYLKKDENVTILERVNDYWLKVRDSSNRVGYVTTQSQYISIQPSSGSSAPSSGGSSPAGATAKAQAVINAGKKYLGTPYEFGSSRSNTKTFDCSDFVRQAFLDALGLKLPADSRGQGSYVKSHNSVTTDWHQLKPGDLMFFMDYKGTSASKYAGLNKSNQTISHVGIYLGDGKVMHTYSKDSGGVRIDSIAGKHWEYRFLYGGSAL